MTTHRSGSRQTLRQALALAVDDPTKALELLEAGLTVARSEGDQQGVSALARHAAVLCNHMGNAPRAISHCEAALTFTPNEPHLYLAIGNLRRQLGHFSEARAAFARALELARDQGDIDLLNVLDSLLNAPDEQSD